MKPGPLPSILLDPGGLDRLIRLLLKMEARRKTLSGRDLGNRVTSLEEAERLLQKVARCTERVLGRDLDRESLPRLALTDHLSRLPAQTAKACLIFWPLGLVLSWLVLALPMSPGMRCVLMAPILCLLVTPLLLHRRVRLHVEHRCGYGQDEDGRGFIRMDHLPPISFQSYLSHEYAHHILASRRHTQEKWMREGWARFVQWKVACRLSRREDRPAHLYPVLVQIIGELKFACGIIATRLNRPLPLKVRLIRTLYTSNPLVALLTGTPLTPPDALFEHAVGTAVLFLLEREEGTEAALKMELDEMKWSPTGKTRGPLR